MSSAGENLPPLPGGIGITHLKVYESESLDGLRGGSPHVHFACTEAYCVVGGRGRVQSLDASGFKEIELLPGKIVWFTPGVIHRLINDDSKLELIIPMQNSGLPEAGDFVLTFPEEILRDSKKYAEASAVAPSGHVFASGIDAATRRRDLAVEGFTLLRKNFEETGPAALELFFKLALPIVQPKLAKWREVWQSGAMPAAIETGFRLEHLEKSVIGDLMNGRVSTTVAGPERKLGMCGTLLVFLPEGVTK